MKDRYTLKNLPLYLSWLIGLILVLLPFHAFLTVWASSLAGHYTLLRLWKEFLLIPLSLGATYLLVRDKVLLRRFKASWLVRLIIVYALLLVASGLIALAGHHVTSKAMWYGLLVNLRFLVFFLVVWIIASKSDWLRAKWRLLLLGPAIVVSAFAIIQFWVLPYDFLKHFGYGDNTIAPYETINHNLQHLRVGSTLRGANPLGAYLLLPLSGLAVLLFKNKKRRFDGLLFGIGLLLALVFSFSRSAWIGAVLSLLVIIWLLIKSHQTKKLLAIAAAAVVVVGAGLGFSLRHNPSFQNTFLHSQTNSAVPQSSDEQHGSAFKQAIKDIYHQPLGGGVGTAGPQSYYNHNQQRIAENYFLQIGQEAGLLAIALFVAINVLVARELWRIILMSRSGHKKDGDSLALWLLASFVGLTFINLLSHAWTDDSLAYLWWGLAGIAIGVLLSDNKHKQIK